MTRKRITREEQERRYEAAMERERALMPRHLTAVPDVEAKTGGEVGVSFVLPPGARDADPPQSAENAAKVDAKAIAWIILGIHATFGADRDGLTDDDAAHLAGYGGHESYRRRGSDLRANGWIEWKRDADGKIVRRRTQSIGGTAGVCVLTVKGRDAWEARA